jgi:hypothetical protein
LRRAFWDHKTLEKHRRSDRSHEKRKSERKNDASLFTMVVATAELLGWLNESRERYPFAISMYPTMLP